MKILQKRTSRFVASLFNGLGIIACVSVSSCGSKGKNPKGNETDDFDGLKKKLKEANDNFEQLDFDDQNKIAEWFKDSPSQTNFSLTKDILQQIFVNDVNTLKSVAQTLGVDISDTDNEEKTKNVTVEIEKEGKASIVYSDNHSESFDFKDIDALKNFVNALADKNVVGVKGEKWSLVLENDKAIVCEHKDGFDYKNNFDEFLSCLNSLVKITSLGFSGFKMTVDINGVSLDGYKLNDGDCQKIDFWQNVNKYAALFGLDNSKLYIEQKDEKVKINGFVTELMWSVVAEDEKNVNATWKSVFVIKGKEEEEKRKEEEERKKKEAEEAKKKKQKEEEEERKKKEAEEAKKKKQKEEEEKRKEEEERKKKEAEEAKKKKQKEEEEKEKTIISYDATNNVAKVGGNNVPLTNLGKELNNLQGKKVEIVALPKWDNFKTSDNLVKFLNFVQILKANSFFRREIGITAVSEGVYFDKVRLQCGVDNADFWHSMKSFSSLFENKLYIKFVSHSVWFDELQISHNDFLGKTGYFSIRFKGLKNVFFDEKQGSKLTLKKEWENLFSYK